MEHDCFLKLEMKNCIHDFIPTFLGLNCTHIYRTINLSMYIEERGGDKQKTTGREE